MMRLITTFKKKIFKQIAKNFPGNGIRKWLLRLCNYQIGRDVYIGEDLIIIDDLGDNTRELFIGERVSIAPRVTLVLHTQPNEARIAEYVNSKKGKIVIEDDVWLGTGAVILPDIVIGEGAVVGANSVVTKSVPSYTIVGGVPARKIREIDVPWRDRPVLDDEDNELTRKR